MKWLARFFLFRWLFSLFDGHNSGRRSDMNSDNADIDCAGNNSSDCNNDDFGFTDYHHDWDSQANDNDTWCGSNDDFDDDFDDF